MNPVAGVRRAGELSEVITMADQNAEHDRLLDSNLRTWARQASIPAEPDAAQQARWKQEAPPERRLRVVSASPNTRTGGSFMHRHPRLTAGSAVAAAVALSAFLITPRSSEVQAGMIMRSFTDRIQQNGLRLTFENIGDEGVRVSGRFFLDFGANGAGGQDFDPRNDRLLLEAHVKADENAPDVGGLELDTKIVLSQQESWVYVRPTGIPAALEEEEPAAVALFSWASSGVLLDLNDLAGILDAEDMEEIRNVPSEIAKSLREAMAELHGEKAHDHGDGDDDDDSSDDDEPAPGDAAAHGAKVEIHATSDSPIPGLDEAALEATVMGLMTGQASPEQLQKLVDGLGQAARSVKVQQVSPGVHVLTASGFSLDALGAADDPEAARWLERMEFAITYREKVGVESARITHLGRYDGVINFEMTSAPIDPTLMSSAVYRNDSRTTVLNLGSLVKLAESITGEKLHIDAK